MANEKHRFGILERKHNIGRVRIVCENKRYTVTVIRTDPQKAWVAVAVEATYALGHKQLNAYEGLGLMWASQAIKYINGLQADQQAPRRVPTIAR